MARGIIGKALAGAASGAQAASLVAMKEQILTERAARLAEYQGNLLEKKYEIESRGRREIGAAITAAGQPVSGTGYDEEGNEITTSRTPTRAEQLAAGERAALAQGDIATAKSLRDMTATKFTKLNENETLLNERGEVIFSNTAGADRRTREMESKHRLDVERDNLKAEREYRLKRQLEIFKKTHGSEATTSMIRNIEFMKENGIADDTKSAFDMLRSSMNKPDDQATLDLAKTLMRGSGYRGRDGQQRALTDAAGMLDSLRQRGSGGGRGASAESSFGTAEDVRSAYRAGRLSRDAAMRELQRFGLR